MYLALLILLLGWVTYLGSVASIVVVFLFTAYIARFQIRPEERILASKFEESYVVYCGSVRRWI
ncbi:MAG: protein-S-isoprenylcysteine O-methyltransferase Ste14 [Gammaproteobacteria bacterium]|jgi:protein-S-isoprenylcysteine O-methyltransferase Ste14